MSLAFHLSHVECHRGQCWGRFFYISVHGHGFTVAGTLLDHLKPVAGIVQFDCTHIPIMCIFFLLYSPRDMIPSVQC